MRASSRLSRSSPEALRRTGARRLAPRADFGWRFSMRRPALCRHLLLLAPGAGVCRFVADVAGSGASATGRGASAPPRLRSGQDGGRHLGAQGHSLFREEAGVLMTVRELAAKSPDEAGAKYGYRPKTDRAPWTLMVRIEGRSSPPTRNRARRRSRSMTTGEGKADATVQIGPAMRGTAHSRRAGLRLVQRFHQPDRLRALRQGVQHACRQDSAGGPAARTH